MKPEAWKAVLSPHVSWQIAYGAVQVEVQAYLGTSDRGNITTNELVEALYPLSLAVGDGITARNRIYHALKQLATRGLRDYCTKSTVPNKYGRYGWMWHVRKEETHPLDRWYSKLIEWINPYLTPDDEALGREGFLGALSDRIVDDLEALERNGHG